MHINAARTILALAHVLTVSSVKTGATPSLLELSWRTLFRADLAHESLTTVLMHVRDVFLMAESDEIAQAFEDFEQDYAEPGWKFDLNKLPQVTPGMEVRLEGIIARTDDLHGLYMLKFMYPPGDSEPAPLRRTWFDVATRDLQIDPINLFVHSGMDQNTMQLLKDTFPAVTSLEEYAPLPNDLVVMIRDWFITQREVQRPILDSDQELKAIKAIAMRAPKATTLKETVWDYIDFAVSSLKPALLNLNENVLHMVISAVLDDLEALARTDYTFASGPRGVVFTSPEATEYLLSKFLDVEKERLGSFESAIETIIAMIRWNPQPHGKGSMAEGLDELISNVAQQARVKVDPEWLVRLILKSATAGALEVLASQHGLEANDKMRRIRDFELLKTCLLASLKQMFELSESDKEVIKRVVEETIVPIGKKFTVHTDLLNSRFEAYPWIGLCFAANMDHVEADEAWSTLAGRSKYEWRPPRKLVSWGGDVTEDFRSLPPDLKFLLAEYVTIVPRYWDELKKWFEI